MKKNCLIYFASLMLIFALFGCAGTQTTSGPPPNTYLLVGDWEEDWPGDNTPDRYRVQSVNQGYSVSIQPLTDTHRQQVTNIQWDGNVLRFTLMYDNAPIKYELRPTNTGQELVGQAELSNGNIKNITWRKGKPWPPRNQLQSQYSYLPQNWAGDWEEDWSLSSGHDRYRIDVQGSQIEVGPLNNTHKQKLSDVRWTGDRLTFTMVYSSITYHYELVPQDANTLDGVATSRAGKIKRIRWRRFNVGNTNLLPQWNALWEENWPNRDEKDLYQIIANNSEIQIIPLTNVEHQQIDNISFDGVRLFFRLHYKSEILDYALTMDATDSLRGTATNSSGTKYDITWQKMPPPPQEAWNGTWQEQWPDRSEFDAYEVQIARNIPSVIPLTNLQKQKITNLEIEGATLSFSLTFNENPIEYSLTLISEDRAVGTARMSSGKIHTITWNKKKTPQQDDWAGNWEEELSGDDFNDKFQIRLDRKKLYLKPLTSLHRQAQISAVVWEGTSLSFKVTQEVFSGDQNYANDGEKQTWEYKLNLIEPGEALGSIIKPDGTEVRVSWTKINDEIAPTSRNAWNGSWEEYWPNSDTNDAYQLRVVGGTIKIKPKTKQDVQSVTKVRFDGTVLQFRLRYKKNVFQYYLTVQDEVSIRGTAVNIENNRVIHIEWNKLQD